MAKMFQVYGIGQALIPVLPPPLPFQNPPTSNQTNYEIGQEVYTPPNAPTAFYKYAGGGNWVQFASGSGDILAINGTANQITASTTSGTTTLSLPSAITAPGSLTTTTTLASGTTLTAGTTVTATLGNITATNGNIVLGTAGNKLVSTSVASTTTAGANSFGTVTLSSGTATISTTAVTANSIILLTRQSVGSSTALGQLTVGTIVAGTSFVISAATQGTPGTPLAADVSVIGWMIIN